MHASIVISSIFSNRCSRRILIGTFCIVKRLTANPNRIKRCDEIQKKNKHLFFYRACHYIRSHNMVYVSLTATSLCKLLPYFVFCFRFLNLFNVASHLHFFLYSNEKKNCFSNFNSIDCFFKLTQKMQ
jgi:hypothetical protein